MCKHLISNYIRTPTVFKNCRNYSAEHSKYVPKYNPVLDSDVKLLEQFIFNSRKIAVLTGAGISTESGIPDYRSEKVGLYARTNHKPTQHAEFLKSDQVRQRYWARNYVGWDNFSNCQPNPVHFSIKNLECDLGKVSTVVTQNVDGLHYKAGSKNVIELHGTAFRVECLYCNAVYDRRYIQENIKSLNPHMSEVSTMVRPDGDVDIPVEAVKEFIPPSCDVCQGILKPDITFFGDNVPLKRVSSVATAISSSDSLLVLGSSLSVYSGYRIVLQAVEEKKNIAIVNIGATRADKLVNFRISTRCGDILPKIC